MPVLTLRSGRTTLRVSHEPNATVREILDRAGIDLRFGCGGRGVCGECRVRVIRAEADGVNEPTPAERSHLTPAELSAGVRLACRLEPIGDTHIRIESPALAPDWSAQVESAGDIDGSQPAPAPSAPRTAPQNERQVRYGVAVDLGTTHISMAVRELSSGGDHGAGRPARLRTGRRVAARRGRNPQAKYGSDVMSRLTAAAESAECAEGLSRDVIAAIGEALSDVANCDKIDLHSVIHLTIVGNTPMLSLLSGKRVDGLLDPRLWSGSVDCLPEDTGPWKAAWGLAATACVSVVPPVAGFIGSDLSAGVAATGLMEGDSPALLIDFGTNSEIALWDGRSLWVASAAGGPAFEGSGIACGMPSEAGAVYRVDPTDGPWATGQFEVKVIEGAQPRGLCGSGVVDLIAALVASGTLSREGRFAPDVPGNRFVVVNGRPDIVLTKHDVDMFQRAKAAVGAGIDVLCAKSGVALWDLARVCVGGAFGRHVRVTNAQAVGLLPKVAPERVEHGGNTALTGCEDFLIPEARAGYVSRVREKARIVDLSQSSEFDERFLEHLYLRPIG